MESQQGAETPKLVYMQISLRRGDDKQQIHEEELLRYFYLRADSTRDA